MAKERVTNFDADSFIESVRESSVPSYHAAKHQEENEKVNVERQPKKMNASHSEVVYEIPDDDVDECFADLDMSDTEIDYIKTYVFNNSFRKVNQNGKPIVIRSKHLTMIKKILRLLNEDANMANYIDNVLIQHFKQFYPTIVEIYKKFPPQF